MDVFGHRIKRHISNNEFNICYLLSFGNFWHTYSYPKQYLRQWNSSNIRNYGEQCACSTECYYRDITRLSRKYFSSIFRYQCSRSYLWLVLWRHRLHTS